jgi:hypothetical protein
MTAPVVTVPQPLDMTAPVLTSPQTMQFILPKTIKSLDEAPEPTNPAISLRSVPAKVIAVCSFTGGYDEGVFRSKLDELFAVLQRESFVTDRSGPRSVPQTLRPDYLGRLLNTIPHLRFRSCAATKCGSNCRSRARPT